jgi:flagellar basal body-associated protein FliL
MAANRLEQGKPAEEGAAAAENKAGAAPVKRGGGTWVPLIANIILMPAIAWALATFVLIPKIKSGSAGENASGSAEESHSGSDHGAKGGKGKVTVPLTDKVLVNVAGTAQTRYLVARISLVGKREDLKAKVEENDPQLRDAAASILAIKTIGDLEKPGMRNIIRAELIAAFNDILGKEAITDIYLTEFAVQ